MLDAIVTMETHSYISCFTFQTFPLVRLHKSTLDLLKKKRRRRNKDLFGNGQIKITVRIFAGMFMNSFPGLLYSSVILKLFTNTQVPRAQILDVLCLRVDSDSVVWPAYAHLRGQKGFGWVFAWTHLQFVYFGGKILPCRMFCYAH